MTEQDRARSRATRAAVDGLGAAALGRLAGHQYRLERKMFWRNPTAAFFNFVLPLLFLGLFGAMLHADQEQLKVIVPGIAGMAMMATTFNALAFNITCAARAGMLKRVRGTPLPTVAYLAGVAGNAVTNAVRADRDHRRSPARCCSGSAGRRTGSRSSCSSSSADLLRALGVALSHPIPNFDAAPALREHRRSSP